MAKECIFKFQMIYQKKKRSEEVTSLLSIKDSYPKLIIARTKHPEADYKGVSIIDIAEFLG